MSKILLIGDYHLGMSFTTNFENIYKVHNQYFNDFLYPLIKREITKDDIIVFMGDLFDNRTSIPINVLNTAFDMLEMLTKICPVHILIGNHDLYNKASNDINSVRIFKYINNLFIYETPKVFIYNNKKILMLPWVEKKKTQIEILKEYSGCDYLFAHTDLNGAKMHLNSAGHKNPDKIGVEEFTGFKKVYAGHYHIRQTMNNFTYVGSVFQMDRNDTGDQKGIYILDTETYEEVFIPNKISPEFKKIYLMIEEDLHQLDNISTKDYIDLFISNSLLISNRKLRRKIETILETGNFTSVEYIDDINVSGDHKENIKENNISDSDIESSFNLNVSEHDYIETIINYIKDQQYENERIKDGMLKEFEELANIYNKNYKNL